MSDTEGIDCGICFELYDPLVRIPKILKCGHSICVVCLQENQK